MQCIQAPSRRRVLVGFYTARAVSSIQKTVSILHQLWDEVSMGDHERIDRITEFYQALERSMNEVIESEKKMVDSVHWSIDQGLKEVEDVRKELGMPAFDSSGFLRGSVALSKAVEMEKKLLQMLKKDRLTGQVHLVNELYSVAVRIGEEITGLSESEKTELWDSEKMDFWQRKLGRANCVLNERLDQARQWKADLGRWFGQSETRPVTEIESTFYAIDLDDPDLVLDLTFMGEFREAHQMAKDGYCEWIEQADFEYTETIIQLMELWELCHIPEKDHRFALKFNPDLHTAGDIRNAKADVRNFTRLYEERAAVYDKLKEWKDLWAEKVNDEKHANEKSYYKNRGGHLNKLLKRQRYIEGRLTVLYRELEEACNSYKSEHPGQPILLEGLEPNEYVEWIKRKLKEQKVIGRNSKKGSYAQCLDPNVRPKKRPVVSAFSTSCSASKTLRTPSKTPVKKVRFS